MPAARSYVEHNTRERERLRGLVERLGDDELRRPVNEHWTVAGVLGHIAFWDARALVLADKLERGVPFSPSDAEPEKVDWVNDATRPLILASRRVRRPSSRCAWPRRPTTASPPCRPLWPPPWRAPAARSIRCAPRTAPSISMRSNIRREAERKTRDVALRRSTRSLGTPRPPARPVANE